MSTYVFSDVHGHRATLERALDRVSPCADDHFFCLGDMIDRGPDPVGVLRVCRSLPNLHALMGNHEDLMISCLDNPGDPLATMNWGINGGAKTSAGLAELSDDEANELVEEATKQAQSIVDSAVSDANNIRESAVQYTDSLLANLQSIMENSMETTKQRYEGLFGALQNTYQVCLQNRSELAAGMQQAQSQVQIQPQVQAQEAPDVSEEQN